MGIYDRDYYRQEQPGSRWTAPRSAVAVLIAINVAVFVAELFFSQEGLAGRLSAHPATLTHPQYWWQLLTYGFVHDTDAPPHIIFNMLALWFLGRDVEAWYGTREFVRIYLVLLVFGSLVWCTVNYFDRNVDPEGVTLLGASGAVTGVVVLYALCFPRRTLLFMFVLPMPAWAVGILVVVADILGATGWVHNAGPIAYSVHLAGAALAFVYHHQQWNFGRLLGSVRWPWRGVRVGRPRLRIHAPEDVESVPEEEVDRILEKIHREGESHLTRKERRILEDASREYQRRRRHD